METRRDERISQLIQALKRSDKLHLKEAASLLGVSEMTIRRDLNGHSGPVVLLGGYIVLSRAAPPITCSAIKNPAGRGKTPCRSPCGRAAGGPSDGLLRLRDHHAVDY